MERRAGRYRAQLLLQGNARAALHRLMDAWVPLLEQLPGVRRAGAWMSTRSICSDHTVGTMTFRQREPRLEATPITPR